MEWIWSWEYNFLGTISSKSIQQSNKWFVPTIHHKYNTKTVYCCCSVTLCEKIDEAMKRVWYGKLLATKISQIFSLQCTGELWQVKSQHIFPTIYCKCYKPLTSEVFSLQFKANFNILNPIVFSLQFTVNIHSITNHYLTLY